MAELHAHSAGDTENIESLKLSQLQTEPIVLLAATAILAQALSAGLMLGKRQWIPGILVSLGIALTGAVAAHARSLVTPMSRPRDLDGDPLTPLAAFDEEE